MTLILSIEKDLTTSSVIDWLIYQNTDFTRINYEELVDAEIEMDNGGIKLSVGHERKIKLNGHKKYWYRRGNFNLKNSLLQGNTETISVINQDKIINCDSVKSYLHDYLKLHVNSVNSYQDNNINKLTELTIAKQIGLSIPNTLITTSKKSALTFIDQHEEIIIKPLHNNLNISIDGINFYWHTLLVTKEEIENFPDTFSYIKLQAYIEKAFELRVFYLNDRFYASAIFSQNDEQTKIDFRNYNNSNPNRIVPYNLPKAMLKKLRKFMKLLNLRSGSFDIIVTKTGEYVFLEVNPIGQFAQVSYPCNYYLEKEMASCLAN